MSLGQLVASIRDRLQVAGVVSPAVDAELLVAWCAGMSRGELVAAIHRGDDATSNLVDVLSPLVARREQREPLQHLLGVAPFMDFELRVGPGVFVPRPETQSLAEHAIAEAHLRGVSDTGIRVLDLCSGSGALAIALARAVPWAEVTAVEASPEAIAYLEKNVSALAPEVSVVGSSVEQFHQSAGGGSWDLIVSNPPYVPDHEVPNEPEVQHYDPPMALFGGVDGLDVIRQVVDLACEAMRPGGVLLMEHSNLQGAAVADLLRTRGLRLVATEKDLVGRERFTHGVVG